MRSIAGTYRFRPSTTQERFIEVFGRARGWQGFYGGDLVGSEHRAARALEYRRYLRVSHPAGCESWRYEWLEKAKAG